MDYLNEKNQAWEDPSLADRVYNYSFIDLYEQALARMDTYLLKLESYLRGDCDIQGIFEGYSYDTGLVWDSPLRDQVQRAGPGLLKDAF